MNFENAHKGIGLLFTGLILEIIAEVLAGVGLIAGASAKSWETIVVLVLVLVAAGVGIASFIQTLRGLIWAKKDEPCFGYALAITIATLVASALASIFGTTGNAGGIGTTIVAALGALFECVTIVLVCDGISNIYRQKGNIARAKEGLNTGIIFVIVYAVAKALEILVTSSIASKGTSTWSATLILILAIVTVVLTIVAFVKFVVYLNRARQEI